MTAISQTTSLNCIFLNENVWISISISLKFVPKDRIIHIAAFVLAIGWAPIRRQTIIWTNDG